MSNAYIRTRQRFVIVTERISTSITFTFMEYFSLARRYKVNSHRRTIYDRVAGMRRCIHVSSHRVTFTTLTLDNAHLDAEHVPKQTSLKAPCCTNKFATTSRTVAPVTMDTWRTLRYTAGITLIVSATMSKRVSAWVIRLLRSRVRVIKDFVGNILN